MLMLSRGAQVTKRTYSDLSEEEKDERRMRMIRVLIEGHKAREQDKRISEEDIISAATAAYAVDPKKGGH